MTNQMSIKSAYDCWSNTYDLDRNLTRDLDREVTKEVFSEQRFENILELGCGTGKNTLWLAEISESVHALDFSEGMIQQARQKLNAKNVEFGVADITLAWPSKTESHDLIVCNLILEHIENLSPIFSEAYRCLQQGGRFYISELHPFRQYRGGRASFQHEGQVTEVAAFVHHVSDFLQLAAKAGLVLESFNEYWHPEDEGKPPRLAAFLFKKA